MRTKSNLILAAVLLILISPVLVSAQVTGGDDPAYDEAGFNTNRDTLLLSDFEDIDTFTGGLTLTHTDLKIPGNGGLDLVIQRTFNSKLVCKSWQAQCFESCYVTCPSGFEDSPIGVGWTMHLGKLKVPALATSSINPIVEMPDGSSNEAYLTDGSGYITKDHWILKSENNGWVLKLTDGRKITFGHTHGYENEYVTVHATQIEDVNGNVIYIYYRSAADPGNLPGTIDYIQMGNSSDRRVYFEYQKIDYTYRLIRIRRPDGIYINYSYTQPQYETHVLLTQVAPPVGSPWQYSYNMSTTMHDLTRVVTPSGGIIDYVYDITGFNYGPGSTCYKAFRTLSTRTTSGRIPSGTWEFYYFQETNNESTLVKDPCGWWHRHTYYGYNSGLTNGNMWRLGLPKLREIVGYKAISYEWSPSASISNNQYFGNQSCLEFDYVIYVPNLTSKTITKDRTYTTNYSNYDSYGNPGTISESGNQTRTTNISYWYNTSKNIVKNKLQSQTVSGSLPGSFTTNYTYDSSTGNPTQINKYGITTNYTYYSNGNLNSEVDANGNTTSYEWSNGRISKISTPAYTINKSINTMGTIASETNGRGNTTSYSYDANLRLTQISPPAGNSTTYSYASDNTYKSETRGGFSAYYYYDGLGRLTSTQNSLGVVTNIGYRACGIKEYTTSNIGDTVQYDIFGRKSSVTHQDNSHFDFVYSGNNTVGNDFTVGNELGYVDRMFYYNSFGNPDEKWLVQVTDGYNNTANYSCNILGSLTGISQSGVNRGFSYDSRNFLTSETHPEKGTISYGRDSVGNMTSKTDALGSVSYSYDGVYRLTGINYGTGTIGFSYDGANNRTSMTNPSASISYSYDPSNRQTTKNETISGRNYTTNFSYDGNDNITNITYPSGRSINYSYNSNNQVTSVTGFGGSVTNISYCGSGSCIGLPQSYTTSNGLTTNLSYSNRNLTTGIQVGTSALNIGYGYDLKGNTTSIIDNLYSSKNLYLDYDNSNRLVSYRRPDPSRPDDPRVVLYSGALEYDALGNRTKVSIVNMSDPYNPYFSTINYSYSNNKLASLTTGGSIETLGYNGYGDMTLLRGAVLNYDRLHNLISYENEGISLADFAYDGDGMRVTKTSGGSTIVYHYDQGGRVTTENTGNGAFISDYIYLHGKLIAKIIPDDFAIPVAPSNLTASVVSSTQVNLVWSDNSGNEAGFKIERKTGTNLFFEEITSVGTNVISYADTIAEGMVYYYRIKAYNANGNSGYSNEVKITPPNIKIFPSTYNFGDVHIGESKSITFSIQNVPYTDMNLVIGTISIGGAYASQFIKQSDSCSGRTVAPYESCEVEVIFAPTSVGLMNANISISSNDVVLPVLNVLLIGTGLPPKLTVLKFGAGGGDIVSSPAGIDCGSECIETSAMYMPGTVVTLTAIPDAYSTFTGWSGAGCLGTGTCSITLNASTSVVANFDLNVPESDLENGIYMNTNGDKLIIKVGSTPTTSGVPGDIVHIQFRTKKQFDIIIDGWGAWIYITDGYSSYYRQIRMTERKENDEWVYRYDWDTTGLNPSVYKIYIQDRADGLPSVSAMFNLGNPSLGVKLYNDEGYTTQTDVFAQGDTVYVEFKSTISMSGIESILRGWQNTNGNFIYTNNTIDQTGTTLRFHFTADFTAASIHDKDWCILGLDRIEKPIRRKDNISISPERHDFGNVNVGTSSTAQTFTVSNVSAQLLTINSVLITGDNASEFNLTADNCTGKSLNPNESCLVQVVFTPEIDGIRNNAVLGIASSATIRPNISLTLSGTGVEFPAFWTGTKQFGTSGEDYAYGVAVDNSGNVYVTGCTEGRLGINEAAGNKDIFLIKYDSAGIKQWTQQIGTHADDCAYGVAVDNNGGVYVTGETWGGLDGNINASGFDVASDIFLIKYNTSGEKQWTRQLGTSESNSGLPYDVGTGIAVDSSGNVYVTGYTRGSLDGNTNTGLYDVFLVKYNSSGEKQWTRQFGTSDEDFSTGVAVDTSDNVYVTGYTRGSLDGNTNTGLYDVFLVKYNSSGEKQWTRQFGTQDEDYSAGIAVDSNENIYVTGLVSFQESDVFLVKYNSSGVKQWTQQLGSSAYDKGNGVTVDNNGNIYVTGETWGGLDGSTNAGGPDIFLVKYNSLGVKQWTQQLGTQYYDIATGVAVNNNYIYVTGHTQGGLDWNINLGGTDDVFLVKFDSNGVKQPASDNAPRISISPASQNFGDINTGNSSTAQTFTITNNGTEDLVINTTSITGANASEFTKSADTCAGQTLNQDASCTIQVIFSPATTGAKNAALAITSNDPNNPTVNIILSGNGVISSAPVISVSPTSYNFGDINTGNSSTVQTFTVTNSGTADLIINAVSITGTNASEFTKNADTCAGQTLAPNASCKIQVIFSPATTGAKSAALTITSNDPANPNVNVTLSGNGVVPPVPIISITPVSYDFGNINTGSSASQTFTVSNTGTGTLTVNTVVISGTNSSEFSKMSDNCTGMSVVPSGNCQIQIAFNPATIGVKTATLSVSSNDLTSPTKDVLLNGTGVVPPAPIISVSPATYNFGDINTGSSSTAQAFTISNTGNASLIINTVDISGSNASEFNKVSDACAGQTLNPNASCTIQITFSPVTTGPKTAVLTITSNAPANPTLNVTLSGTGIEVPAPTDTIIINGGATSTDERNVRLQLTCPYPSGCSRMQFSNNGVRWSNPERFRTTDTFRLSGRDGLKTIYVRFRDTAGNWSAPYTATILLDTTNPNTTALPSGGRYNTAQTVTLACEDGSGSGCDKIYYTTDGSRPTKSSPVYTEPILISQTTTLKYFAIDKVGNREAVNRQRYRIR